MIGEAKRFHGLWVLSSLLLLLGCSDGSGVVIPSGVPLNPVDLPEDAGPTTGIPEGGLLGDDCEFSAECRAGLICDEGVCAAPGDKSEGSNCTVSAECADGLMCGLPSSCTTDSLNDDGSGAECVPQCVPEGEALLGELCVQLSDCAVGSYCDFIGMVGTCKTSGEADVTQSCTDSGDCAHGLLCAEGECQGTLALLGNLGEGRKCAPDPDIQGKVLFEIPSSDSDSDEFYRLPFPNDIRVIGGKIDLTGHPRIGGHIYGFDPAERIIEGLESSPHGYSTTGSVYFRFTRAVSLAGIRIGQDKNPGDTNDTLALIDITPSSPEYGKRKDIMWSAEMGEGTGGRFICDNWLMVRPLFVRPLRPGTTYAAVLMEGIQDKVGEPILPGEDFASMLALNAPGESTMKAAWTRYQPLRDFVSDGTVELPVSAERLLGAAVFTTGEPGAALQAVRQAVSAGPSPNPRDWEDCEQAGTCAGSGTLYHELQGTADFPVLQDGDGEFLTPADGGTVSFDIGVSISKTLASSIALSIPKNLEMPEAGWPLVIYAHGTGFDRTLPFVDESVAELSNIQGETLVGAAVLTFDQQFHGSRSVESVFDPADEDEDEDDPAAEGLAGASWPGEIAPALLMSNLGNPEAMQGNVYQAVADLYSAERIAASIQIPASESPNGDEVRIDLGNVFIVGHSIGATAAILASSQSLITKGVVLGGVGGGTPLSFVERTQPLELGAYLGLFFADIRSNGDSRVTTNHPLLGLLHHLLSPVDPLSVAEQMFVDPPSGVDAKHVLLLWGIGDSYAGDSSVTTLASAMRLTQIQPIQEAIPYVTVSQPGVKLTWDTVTAGVSDHVPLGEDGHFVLMEHPDARRQAFRFVGTALESSDGVPTIVP